MLTVPSDATRGVTMILKIRYDRRINNERRILEQYMLVRMLF